MPVPVGGVPAASQTTSSEGAQRNNAAMRVLAICMDSCHNEVRHFVTCAVKVTVAIWVGRYDKSQPRIIFRDSIVVSGRYDNDVTNFQPALVILLIPASSCLFFAHERLAANRARRLDGHIAMRQMGRVVTYL